MKKERCQCCNTGLDPEEIYTDFFYCAVCHKNFPYIHNQPERSKREDLFENEEYKNSSEIQKIEYRLARHLKNILKIE